ncbi:MAG: response regulator [Candidatus Omnitrophica bacterium]|nr:response regulator [Candidatus Omnitrophota bacterium]
MDSLTAKKVMVIDDEKDFLFTMEYWLKSKGYQVESANDGFKAIELVKSFKPDIILLDINMPGIDGVETLKRIRLINKNVPVIIITAYIGEERVAEASSYQISGLFYKDKDFKDGLILLESVLRTHKNLKKD